MNAERWTEIKRLFDATMERPHEKRMAFIRHACADDEQLFQELTSLLRAHEKDGPADALLGDLQSSIHERLSPERVEGRRVGPYKIVDMLGQGGMGQVFLARRADGQFEQQVALKLLGFALPSEEVTGRFLAERQILASLTHPNISRLLDGGITEHGEPYFVMEVVEGEPIDTYCDHQNCSLRERLGLFLDVCEAVQYAHQKLVVHRDLKPSNILVSDDGRVKLVDFGIAKLLKSSEGAAAEAPRTASRARPMTPSYASPEQVRGDTISTASDVYQLGLLLYRLLTGTLPFQLDEKSPDEIAQIICEEIPTAPSTLLSQSSGDDLSVPPVVGLQAELDSELDAIVMKALRKEPDQRYRSAEQLAEDIRRFIDGRAVSAYPDSFAYRSRKFVHRNRWGIGVSAVITLILVVSIAALSVQNQRIAEERDRVQMEAVKAEHVKEFLIDLFGHTDPALAAQGGVTVDEVLARGAERVERDLADHPEIRAEMTRAVAGVHTRLKQYDQARPLLEEVVGIYKDGYLRDEEQLASALRDLGRVALAQGDLQTAETTLREAHEIRLVRHGEGSIQVAAVEHELGQVMYQAGALEEAKALYERAAPVYREVIGRGHTQAADVFRAKGRVLHETGDLQGAENRFREALSILEKTARPDHPDIAHLYHELGKVQYDRDNVEEAELSLRQALIQAQRSTGFSHAVLPEVLLSLSSMLSQEQRFAEAADYLLDARRISAHHAPERLPGIDLQIHSLAATLMAHHRTEEAQSLLMAMSEPAEGLAAAPNR